MQGQSSVHDVEVKLRSPGHRSEVKVNGEPLPVSGLTINMDAGYAPTLELRTFRSSSDEEIAVSGLLVEDSEWFRCAEEVVRAARISVEEPHRNEQLAEAVRRLDECEAS